VHEMSIALEICRMAEERLGRDALGSLVTVAVEVGDQAGVEVENLEFCLEAVFAGAPFSHAVPVVQRCTGDVLRLAYLEVDDERPAH